MRLRRRTLTLGCLTVALVLGALLALPPMAAAQGPTFQPNHYKCYFTRGKIQGDDLVLIDQFGTTSAKLLNASRFCNPVEKTTRVNRQTVVTPIWDNLAHLTLYGIASDSAAVARSVTVSNQFGREKLTVYDPVALAVPTRKDTLPATNIPPDHFQCYRAAGASRNVRVGLRDQFVIEERLKLLHPVLFCNPTQKEVIDLNNGAINGAIVTPINYPEVHMTCYRFIGGGFVGKTPATENQFGREDLDVSRGDLLCVPSKKDEVVGLESNPVD